MIFSQVRSGGAGVGCLLLSPRIQHQTSTPIALIRGLVARTMSKTDTAVQLQEGDVVRFDYSLWVEGDKGLFETSQAEKAQEAGIFNPERTYRPLTIVMGRGALIPGLERHMMENAAIDATQTVDISPEDAYGPRDPAKIKDVPMAKFRKEKVNPELGMRINLEGQRGVIVRIAGGRVRVDTNNELAGKKLRYEYTLREVVTDDDAKIDAVLSTFFPRGGHSVQLGDDAITVNLPEQVSFDQNWMMGKFRVLQELRPLAGERDIRFVETFPAQPAMPAHGEPGHVHDDSEE